MEPVLTIRQPWASAIFVGGKDVENRKQRTHYRGRLWIQASVFASRTAPDRWGVLHDIWLPDEPLARGVILGSVELVDCVEDSDSVWALPGHFQLLLRRPLLLKRPVPHSGSLTFSWRRPPQGQLVRARRARMSYR